MVEKWDGNCCYRLLGMGEIIHDGDQYLVHMPDSWAKVGEPLIGYPLSTTAIRVRRISPEPAQDKSKEEKS